MTQKDISLLEKFKDIVGFGTICNNSKDVKAWKTNRVGEAKQILEMFRPYLSERRINTAEKLLLEEGKQILRPLSNFCSKGHELIEQNVIIYSNRSGRICRICRNEYAKQWRAKQPKGYWKKYEDKKREENGDV